ncbi:opioid growth factor receptor-related protein [Tuwongella immobilis]|uniref:Opioid growth factor receptor (OGFr) conserved domain-containing protein n=1 Tax=Tuwongella immobilis TaxID=692036 RepID=A0A6C2YRR1_9BACT|nr:opioid growth factor receptor-related protein [Tuwongella immobilis]VIP04047.1 opioid growth factor receptor conserved region : Opioid growth factor receptor (OGFr) conserved region OS=Singulisphaera acidiphila (strain ATCC BAA-1392 / DSM 18658 / VKM B-2454 / MOB10) GN=Sinac_5725 PE=4 SV=1: OGFr_N [Tuwongella immobilis]VTS05461.1 opioid growth factor receptor conserved region : Opioid growth factor receptor (OGFr) conserved region OS=Singulisphaera acidiphila (strain ATCC BAA-1392 / DSM 18658 
MTVPDQPGAFAEMWLAFYGEAGGPNASGYSLEQILAWSNDDWEFQHDFIQWLFPTNEPSRFNPDAPVLDERMIAEFRRDGTAQRRFRETFQRWLRFCGMESTETGIVFVRKPRYVWSEQNHNWLRISRVLRCLRLLGFPSEAAEFFAALQTIRSRIDEETWGYWERAAQCPMPE